MTSSGRWALRTGSGARTIGQHSQSTKGASWLNGRKWGGEPLRQPAEEAWWFVESLAVLLSAACLKKLRRLRWRKAMSARALRAFPGAARGTNMDVITAWLGQGVYLTIWAEFHVGIWSVSRLFRGGACFAHAKRCVCECSGRWVSRILAKLSDVLTVWRAPARKSFCVMDRSRVMIYLNKKFIFKGPRLLMARNAVRKGITHEHVSTCSDLCIRNDRCSGIAYGIGEFCGG